MVKVQRAGIGHYYCSPDWTWKVAGHRNYDLWLVAAGRGFLITEANEYTLQRGDCFLIPPAFPLFAGHDPQHPLEVFAAHFDIEFPSTDFENLPFHAAMRDPAFQEGLLGRLVADAQKGQLESANLWLKAALEEYATSARLPPNAETGPSWHFSIIANICETILKAPEHPWRVRQLAAQAHLSPDHFSRVFTQEQGISPQSFILTARLEKAKTLLIGSSHPIGRVAELAGYESLYYFSRHFKNRTGLSPSRYRQKWLSSSPKSSIAS